MSFSDSEIIMSKRFRSERQTEKSAVFILRGVPGSGKSTTALKIYEKLKDRFDMSIQIISRDNVRKCFCVKHGIDYQASFRDPVINQLVRDKFYRRLDIWLEFAATSPHCLIIDATNTKVADLKHTLWLANHSRDVVHKDSTVPFDIFLITKRKEYGSIHQVPECIMSRFRDELAESDKWLDKHGHHYNIII